MKLYAVFSRGGPRQLPHSTLCLINAYLPYYCSANVDGYCMCVGLARAGKTLAVDRGRSIADGSSNVLFNSLF